MVKCLVNLQGNQEDFRNQRVNIKTKERILRTEDFTKKYICLLERRRLAIFALLHNTERYSLQHFFCFPFYYCVDVFLFFFLNTKHGHSFIVFSETLLLDRLIDFQELQCVFWLTFIAWLTEIIMVFYFFTWLTHQRFLLLITQLFVPL